MAQGLEVLIGVVNDASFGPAVALGLGGVLAEVLGTSRTASPRSTSTPRAT